MIHTRIPAGATRRSFVVAGLMMAVAGAASAQTKPADTTRKAATVPAASKTAAPQTKTPAAPTQSKTTPPATAQTKASPPAAQTKGAPAPTGATKGAPAPTGATKGAPAPTGSTKGAPAPTGATKGAPAPTGATKGAPAPSGQTKGAPAPTGTTGNAPRAGRGGAALNVVRSDTAAAAPLVMMREVFEYDRDGRRDPFLSLLSTTDLRPTLSDLKLLMTVVDEPGRSVALLQDAYEKKQKTVRVGTRLGRMRVSSIRADAVVFTIEEFGSNRRDSLLLRDSTKVRGR